MSDLRSENLAAGAPSVFIAASASADFPAPGKPHMITSSFGTRIRIPEQRLKTVDELNQ